MLSKCRWDILVLERLNFVFQLSLLAPSLWVFDAIVSCEENYSDGTVYQRLKSSCRWLRWSDLLKHFHRALFLQGYNMQQNRDPHYIHNFYRKTIRHSDAFLKTRSRSSLSRMRRRLSLSSSSSIRSLPSVTYLRSGRTAESSSVTRGCWRESRIRSRALRE